MELFHKWKKNVFEFLRETFRMCMKEYRDIFKDKGVLFIFIGSIIFYSILYPVAYSNEVLKEIPTAVINQDHSAMSRQLVRMIDAGDYIKVTSNPISIDQAKKEFYRGDIYGVVLIPKGFEKKVLRGEQSSISAYCDTGYILMYRQLLTGIKYSANTLSAGIEIKRMMSGGLSQKEAMAKRESVKLVSYTLFNPSGGYGAYVMPAVLLLLLQQTMLIGIGMLGGTSREKNAWNYLVPDGMKNGPAPVIAGKGLAFISIYMVHAVYIFGVIFKAFSYPQRGQILDLVVFIVSYLVSTVFFGLAISAFFRNRETSIMFVLITSIPFILFAGFSWPIEAIPGWIRMMSLLVPGVSGMEGFLKISQMGASLSETLVELWRMWILAGIYFIIACFYIGRVHKNKVL